MALTPHNARCLTQCLNYCINSGAISDELTASAYEALFALLKTNGYVLTTSQAHPKPYDAVKIDASKN
jgi:hypothetical protein